MPAGSLEVANTFIDQAARHGRTVTQLQLQNLVYLAHGWCLAITGQPLTTDLPRAWEGGPMYTRLAQVCAPFGLRGLPTGVTNGARTCAALGSELGRFERAIVQLVYDAYKDFSATDLAAVTRRGDTPWRRIFDDGRGKLQAIPHALVRAQFVRLAASNPGK